MKHEIKFWLVALWVAFLFFYAVALAVWEWRNPKANKTTGITHFIDVIKFRKLDTFQ